MLGLVAIIAYSFLTSDNPLGVAEIEKYAIIASTAIFLLLGFTMNRTFGSLLFKSFGGRLFCPVS